MNKMKTIPFEQRLEIGNRFEDFISLVGRDFGLEFSSFSSKAAQYKIGESSQRIEVKHDGRFRETGNFWIEIYDKQVASNPVWILSGIYARNNAIKYLIGDYSGAALFYIATLRRLHRTQKYRLLQIPTSKGFLLPVKDAPRYAIKTFRWPRQGQEFLRSLGVKLD